MELLWPLQGAGLGFGLGYRQLHPPSPALILKALWGFPSPPKSSLEPAAKVGLAQGHQPEQIGQNPTLDLVKLVSMENETHSLPALNPACSEPCLQAEVEALSNLETVRPTR